MPDWRITGTACRGGYPEIAGQLLYKRFLGCLNTAYSEHPEWFSGLVSGDEINKWIMLPSGSVIAGRDFVYSVSSRGAGLNFPRKLYIGRCRDADSRPA